MTAAEEAVAHAVLDRVDARIKALEDENAALQEKVRRFQFLLDQAIPHLECAIDSGDWEPEDMQSMRDIVRAAIPLVAPRPATEGE